MERLKQIFWGLAIGLTTLLGLSGCEAEDNTAPDIKDDVYIIDYGTVLIADGYGSSNNNYIIRDDGIALLVIRDQSFTGDDASLLIANGDRVLINYNVMSDLSPLQLPESCKAGYAIQLNALLTLPCQQTIIGQEPDTECSPVYLNSLHVGKSYLDLRFDYWSISNKKHEFKLYCPNPEDEVIDLYLVHYGDNDKGDDGVMVTSHRISFNIEALRTNTPRMFNLHWIDMQDMDKVHTGTLNAL